MKYIEDEYPDVLKELRKHKFRNETTIQYLFFVLNIDHRLHDNIIINDSKDYFIEHFDNINKKLYFHRTKFVCYNNMDASYKPTFEKLIDLILK